MSSFLFDSSAVLAILFREPGADEALRYIGDSAISTVNLTEVIANLIRAGSDSIESWFQFEALDLEVLPYEERFARRATDLAPLGWTQSLSLGDRACVATAISLNRTVITADRKWTKLNLACPIISIR